MAEVNSPGPGELQGPRRPGAYHGPALALRAEKDQFALHPRRARFGR